MEEITMLFMKMAKAREEDNKGFSLVELIIVIAIMVALVAMLAPQFVKYVQKSRDAVVSQAAEDVLATAKSEFALTKLAFKTKETTSGTITISVDDTNKNLKVEFDDNLEYDGDEDGVYDETSTDFMNMCGVDTTKKTQSKLVYTITITNNGGSPTFTMTSTNS
jgi:prepilin-type N-terminal cleavage/methylation domain-containing protein